MNLRWTPFWPIGCWRVVIIWRGDTRATIYRGTFAQTRTVARSAAGSCSSVYVAHERRALLFWVRSPPGRGTAL